MLWEYPPHFLHIKAEENDITVANDVVLPFTSVQPALTCGGNAALAHKVIICHYLGTDEATLKIAMDLTGGLRCLGALGNRQARTSFGPAVR